MISRRFSPILLRILNRSLTLKKRKSLLNTMQRIVRRRAPLIHLKAMTQKSPIIVERRRRKMKKTRIMSISSPISSVSLY